MNQRIRLVLVEDSAADAELIIREVRRAGFVPDWRRAETEEEFLEALSDLPDAILSDYALPRFDGLRALDIVRGRGLDTPFLLISGTLGEDNAVEALHHGATDYLMKDRTARLGSSLRRALKEKSLRDERRRTEEALLESEERFRAFMSQSPVVAWIKDEDFRFRYINAAFERLVARDADEILGCTDLDIFGPAVAASMQANGKRVLELGQGLDTVELVPAADGTTRRWLVQNFPLRRGDRTWVGGTAIDATARLEAEEALRQSLAEKETLLREVHHRVKNNLQIISSLLHFQSKRAQHDEERAIFRDGQDRLRAMILVHDHLYRSTNLNTINLADYCRPLVEQLHSSFRGRTGVVRLLLDVDDVVVPAQIALPCGMVTTELVTNAFKYAYADGVEGAVRVSVTRTDTGFTLAVSDTGVGLPADSDLGTRDSFGWLLIRNLAEQLAATLTWSRDGGTKVSLAVPLPSTVGAARATDGNSAAAAGVTR